MDEDVTEIASDDFIAAFERVVSYWPDDVDVSEQESFRNGGMRIPALAEVHRQVEDRIENEMDGMEFHVAHVVEFAVFTYLHTQIRSNGLKRVHRDTIDEEKVRAIVNSYDAWSVR